MRALIEKLEELGRRLGGVEDSLASRHSMRSFDEKLALLDAQLAGLAGNLEALHVLAPCLGTLGGRLAALRLDLGRLTSEVGGRDRGIDELKNVWGAHVARFRTIVEEGLKRWAGDQSQVLDRLSSIRNILRDEIRQISKQVDESEPALWKKVTGREPGSLKVTNAEWRHLAANLEEIVFSLESILGTKPASSIDPGGAPSRE